MWEGKVTEELKSLFIQYKDATGCAYPDEYDDLCYHAMSYDEFVAYIKEALRRHCELPDVVD